jgi:hypothetical protein
MKRLKLHGGESGKTMTIAYDVFENPGELLEIVYQNWYAKQRSAGEQPALPRTFHRSLVFYHCLLIYLFVAPAAAGAIACVQSGLISGCGLIGVSVVACALFVAGLGARLGNVTIDENGIVQRHRCSFSRAYSFDEIATISLSRRGIVVELARARKRVVLGHFKESLFEVYDVLLTAWRARRGR